MSTRRYRQVKLVAGVLFPDNDWWHWALAHMTELWGEVQRTSECRLFEKASYYAEIAPRLFRRFVSFRRLVPQDELALWKEASVAMEAASGPTRRVNIDPGFVDGAKLVLVSTKNHAHRVPVAPGFYAEVTLRYRQKHWEPFDYTFPDFRDDRYYSFLTQVRNDWLNECDDRITKEEHP